MPIPEAIVDRVKASQIADLLQHDGVRWGGGLFAAAYLREFTADLPWAHLDIAGYGVQLRRRVRPHHLRRYGRLGHHPRRVRPVARRAVTPLVEEPAGL